MRKHSVGIAVPIATAFAMAVAIFGAFAGSGALGGTPIQHASDGWLDTDSTLLAPAGPAFGIWSLVYVGLVVYAVWQFFPAARASRLQYRARAWISASALLNALWIGVVQFGWLPVSLVVIVVLLLVLIRILLLLITTPPESTAERWILWVLFGVYLGWVSVATIANAAALLGSWGVGEGADWPVPAAIALLAVAAVIALGTTWYSGGHLGMPLAMAWGVGWIGVSRLEPGNYSQPVAIAAYTACGIIVIGSVVLAWVLRRHRDRLPIPARAQGAES